MKLRIASVALAMLLGSGCIVVKGTPQKTAEVAYLSWSFPAVGGQSNPNCQAAGIDSVIVYIDNMPSQTVTCAVGQSSMGWVTPALSGGPHNLTLSAVDSTGYEYFRYTGSFTVNLNTPASQSFTLQWAVGGVALKWTLTEQSTGLTCTQAGVTDVYVNFRDSQGHLVYGSMGDPQACTLPSVEYAYLKPGTYDIIVQAAGTNGRLYQSSMSNPPVVQVTAGVFPPASAALNIIVPRTQ